MEQVDLGPALVRRTGEGRLPELGKSTIDADISDRRPMPSTTRRTSDSTREGG